MKRNGPVSRRSRAGGRLGLVAQFPGEIQRVARQELAELGRPDPVQARRRCRDADRSDDRPGVVEHRGADAAHALLVLLVVDRVAARADPLEVGRSASIVVRVCGVEAGSGADRSSSSSAPGSMNASIALPAPDEYAGTRRPTSVNIRTARELEAWST